MTGFTVIIPNYNHGAFLKERIESVLAQTYQDFELILLDDASTDQSLSIIEQYKDHPKVKAIVVNEQNSGSSFQQWKKGWEMASFDWIWIAESDDTAAPNFLEACANVIYYHENLSLVCTQSNWIDAKGKEWYTRETGFEKEGFRDGRQVLEKWMIHENQIKNASAVVFNKSKADPAELETISQYQWCGDWALWNHLLLRGGFYFIDKPLNFFRRHAGMVSSKYYQNGFLYKEGLRISRRYQHLLDAGIATRMKTLASWSGHLLTQYRSNLKEGNWKVYLFAPLYYCALMHLALPFVGAWKAVKRIVVPKN